MKDHYLKRPSSFIVVVLRSLRHGACVCCGVPTRSLDESANHWKSNLKGVTGYGFTPSEPTRHSGTRG